MVGKEPLATLAKYKIVGNNVIFGQNAIAKQEGSVAVGAVVDVGQYLLHHVDQPLELAVDYNTVEQQLEGQF